MRYRHVETGAVIAVASGTRLAALVVDDPGWQPEPERPLVRRGRPRRTE